MARVGMFGRFDSGRGRARTQQKQSTANSEGHMRIGHPDYPRLESPVVVESGGWWATWHGGEYIDIYPMREGAQLDAENKNTTDFQSVACINTSGDEMDPDDPEAYVTAQLAIWVDEDSVYYA